MTCCGDETEAPPPPPALDDLAVSLLESGAVLRLTYIDGWRHRLALRRPWQAVPDFLASVQMAVFLALLVDVYSRKSVADAQKTVREQVRAHGRLVLCDDACMYDLEDSINNMAPNESLDQTTKPAGAR